MQIQSHPLPQDRQESLSKWLSDPAYDILIQVLESGRFAVQIEAVKCREEPSDSKYQERAKLLDDRAREIRAAIELLNFVRQQKEPYSISSATP